MREAEAGSLPDQNAVGVEHPLGRPRGAGGVDQQDRVFGAGVHGPKAFAGRPQQRIQLLDQHNPLQGRRFQARGGLAVGDRHPGAAVRQPEPQCVDAEAAGQRHRDQAGLVGADVSDGRLRPLGQHHRHPIARPQAEVGIDVGHPVGLPRQLAECQRPAAAV